MELTNKDALIIVDVQNDFLPGGALAVPNGDEVIPILNKYIAKFWDKGASIFATRDWHPEDHCSFKAQGGPWPPHCIAGTKGAAFAPGLELPSIALISKAMYSDNDAYSGFGGTNLGARLRDSGIKRVFIGGLATDYCVKATVQDAVVLYGFTAFYLKDASRAVNIAPGDEEKAEKAMERSGARIITFEDIE
jgi:nicotinamidase/pyrazinamidase